MVAAVRWICNVSAKQSSDVNHVLTVNSHSIWPRSRVKVSAQTISLGELLLISIALTGLVPHFDRSRSTRIRPDDTRWRACYMA
jgi:hypothetical protein